MSVERIELLSREPYEDGTVFGDGGAYERLSGVVRFAVDPGHTANAGVVDLALAPRRDDGLVEFESDFVLLQPADASSGARRLLFSVSNRGRLGVLPFSIARRPVSLEISERIEPGDAFLLRRGWSVLWCGWQWDVMRRPGLVGLEAPQAIQDARPMQGTVLVRFQPTDDRPDEMLSHWPLHPRVSSRQTSHRPYPAADVDEPGARLLVRPHAGADPVEIPRERWRFARDVDGRAVPDDTHVWLEGGFRRGLTYEVVYTTRICPVAGCGLLAVRDAVSFFRYDEASPCRVDHAFGFGVSQSGRFLREYLLASMNVDERGRTVFDGLMPHVAGARRGEFNHRYAQPSVQHAPGFGHTPPFADGDLLRVQRERGGVPKVFTTNTSSEYWRSDASLVHTDVAGATDLDPPDDVRAYLFAGTQHVPGFPALLRELPLLPGARTANAMTTVNFTPLLRAALVNLDRWVSDGVAPPPSAVPRLDDGTAAPREAVLEKFAALPGASILDASLLPFVRRVDLGPDAARGVGRWPAVLGEAFPSYASEVDATLNEVAGVRLPDITVPLASHTGWNPRDPSIGAPGEGVDMLGSSIPLPRTAAERASSGDPRPAIDELYSSRDEFLSLVRKSAEALVADRWLLEEDVEFVLATQARLWDALASQET